MKKYLISAALGLFATFSNASVISTLAEENGTISSWGLPDTAAYGQTFSLDTDAVLNNVVFRINDEGTAITYDLNIFAWAGNIATGSVLGSASGSTMGVDAMQSVDTSLGALALSAGNYVAFYQASSDGSVDWGSVLSDAYDGGRFVFQNNGGDTSQWTTSSWTVDWQGPGFDLAFELDFDNAEIPVSAPTSLLFTGLALCGLFLGRRVAK